MYKRQQLETLKLEGETENMGVCTKERTGVTAEVLMATPCTNSLGGESGGHKHEECEGCRLCWKFAAVSWSGAGGHLWVFLKIIHDTDRGKKKQNVTGTVGKNVDILTQI